MNRIAKCIVILALIIIVSPAQAYSLTTNTVKEIITPTMDYYGIRAYFTGNKPMYNELAINSVIGNLAAQKVNTSIWDTTNLVIFPCSCLQRKDLDDPVAGYTQDTENGKYTILICGQDRGMLITLLHEMGHIVNYKNPGILEQYAKIRSYPYSLDPEVQKKLEWRDKVKEWFAEDFKTIYGDHKPENRSWCTTAPGPEVKTFFEKLVQAKDDSN